MSVSFHISCSSSFSFINHPIIGPRHINIWNCSWFQNFTLLWMLYSFFWVIPRSINFMCPRFGTPCLFHLHTACEHFCSHTVPRTRMSGSKHILPLYAFIARKGTASLLLLISDPYHILVNRCVYHFQKVGYWRIMCIVYKEVCAEMEVGSSRRRRKLALIPLVYTPRALEIRMAVQRDIN